MFAMTPFKNSMLDFDIFDRMNAVERHFFGQPAPAATTFRCDIRELDGAYELVADLPGFAKEDIHLNVEDGCLTIRAEHDDTKEETGDNNGFIRRERYYGVMQRSFDVSGIEEEKISAAFENGVLKLNLPKREEQKPKARQIEIA